MMSLEEYMCVFKQKWLCRKWEVYGGDMERMYQENKVELFEDMCVLWEKALEEGAFDIEKIWE
jgi:hypothetical protein